MITKGSPPGICMTMDGGVKKKRGISGMGSANIPHPIHMGVKIPSRAATTRLNEKILICPMPMKNTGR